MVSDCRDAINRNDLWELIEFILSFSLLRHQLDSFGEPPCSKAVATALRWAMKCSIYLPSDWASSEGLASATLSKFLSAHYQCFPPALAKGRVLVVCYSRRKAPQNIRKWVNAARVHLEIGGDSEKLGSRDHRHEVGIRLTESPPFEATLCRLRRVCAKFSLAPARNLRKGKSARRIRYLTSTQHSTMKTTSGRRKTIVLNLLSENTP
jgi:hypothetical protein